MYKKLENLFGSINLTWKKVIIFAIIAGLYTGIMALLPFVKDTSFEDITISFEVWILFGIILILNSNSNKDSAFKCFIFFLISQPLVYLIQIPFSSQGWNLFNYYGYWFIWTILTIPMGYIGYYLKKDKWWSVLILIPILILLGFHYNLYLKDTLFYFPHHLLTTIFCIITFILYSIYIFKDKNLKLVTLIISILIIIIATILALTNRIVYKPTLISNESDCIFDETYKAYIKDDKMGKVNIEYNDLFDDYIITGEFTKAGKTDLIIESNDGEKQIYDLEISYNKYSITKK